MSAASGLEPINLQIPRRRRVIPASFFVLFAAALWIAGLASSDGRLLSLAVFFAVSAVVMVITWMVAGDEGRWLRLDDEGMTLVGDRIPWEAVITARWAWNALLTGPGVELRLRRVDGYEPPRSGKVAIDPTLFDISGNVLLDLIERYARPHTVYVLAPRHRPDLAIFWLPRVVIGGEGARPVHPRGGAPEPLGIVLRCRSSSIEVMFCGVRWLGASIFIPHAILAGPRSSRICKPARCARPP